MKRLNVNVAETPFVNQAVPLVTAVVLVTLAVALTLFNLVSFVVLGRDFRSQRSELRIKQERLQVLKRDIAEKGKVLGSAGVATFAGEAKFVATLLEEKRFSWTRFLDDLERVKPFGVQFESVQPTFDRSGSVKVSLRGRANQRPELLKLEQNLMADGRFRGFLLQNEQKDTGSPHVRFSLTVQYLPEAGVEP